MYRYMDVCVSIFEYRLYNLIFSVLMIKSPSEPPAAIRSISFHGRYCKFPLKTKCPGKKFYDVCLPSDP
jgi:hypothetical protein